MVLYAFISLNIGLTYGAVGGSPRQSYEQSRPCEAARFVDDSRVLHDVYLRSQGVCNLREDIQSR